jgi:glycine hydroxymethyltransferase
MLIDLRTAHGDVTGKDAQIALEHANITVNKNTVPGETRSPFLASGIRLGTPAVTTRGMGTAEMVKIADLIAFVLSNIGDEAALSRAKAEALDICKKFPLPWD